MSQSVFEIFSIGIGPSSSHTVGPMRAANVFRNHLISENLLEKVAHVKCDFYGSLGLTGKGHGSDKAFILGIQGYTPENIDSNVIPEILEDVKKNKILKLSDSFNVAFNIRQDIKFHRRVSLPEHPNGMAFAVYDKDQQELARTIYYSIGGGSFLSEDQIKKINIIPESRKEVRYPFKSAKELLRLSKEHGLKISEIMFANELTFHSEDVINQKLETIWDIMQKCVLNGLKNEGILPGGLEVKRRAPGLHKKLQENPEKMFSDQLSVLDWVNLYALAVNEENANGGQVVTAPTNGAAGIIPALLHYYMKFCHGSNLQGVKDFLLTSAAIGYLYRTNASISGAEVGCQGEVGVACSMGAGALCELLGGTPEQVANAAEIGMEHNLGLTCDPIGGLVQIPCIERNAMGSIKAINAARIAMRGDGTHHVSLDRVIATMKQTGKDMKKQYKETSRGGLAVNITEC